MGFLALCLLLKPNMKACYNSAIMLGQGNNVPYHNETVYYVRETC